MPREDAELDAIEQRKHSMIADPTHAGRPEA
jgi:hypothetical protein